MEKLSGNENSKIYIIDGDYRIVSYNEELKKTFPELACGQICYEVLCSEDEPCRECPLIRKVKDNAIFYNKKVQKWVEVNSGTIDWPGAGICSMVLAKEIHEGNKSLFFNLTSLTAYDELYELNITQNTYKVLYQMEGKYPPAPPTGSLTRMLGDMAEQLIHPEDRKGYYEFWNLHNIMLRLAKDSAENVLRGQCRKKMQNGEYCWVLQTVVPLRYGAGGDKIIMCFIQDINTQKTKQIKQERQSLIQENYYDSLTGLYKKNIFFARAEEFLKAEKEKKYCLMAVDIEHFKIFNEWYGQEAGDRFLVKVAGFLNKAQESEKGIAGYVGDDDFVIILPDDRKAIKRLQDDILFFVKQYGGNAGFLPAYGMFEITDKNLSVSTMYDRASIALESVKGNYAKRVSWYDTAMMQRIEENHMLLSEVQRALTHGEFVFYAQPKCNMMTGKIIGLESLVRWIHPERGLVPPNEFIPLLENSGFIANLDMYVWDKVCSSVRKWLDNGHRAVPISVNVSRVDIYTVDVVDCFCGLVKKYRLDPSLIEIEITESAYAENYNIIKGTVEKLRKSGFTVLMDDFGSGYSSLNMLKDVNVDILKIDMKFLDMSDESADRGVGILEAIASMARLMGIRVIAEGVETKEQVEFLLDMGCIYAQGYYFYKPMPVEVFEPLLTDADKVDFRGIKAREIERFRIKDMFRKNVFSETMMNNILGGIAFYDVYKDEVELIRVNEQYYRITETDPVELEENKMRIFRYIYENDRSVMLGIFREAFEKQVAGASGVIRRLKGNGKTIWMHIHVFFLKEQDGHRIYYGAVSDVTVQKEREAMLESSQRALSAVVHVSENDASFMKLTEENRKTAATIFAQMSPGGMIGGYCEEGFPLYFANYEMIRLLGYESYEELSTAIGGMVVNTIHPDDRERVANDIGEYYPGAEYTTTYRMPKKDGTWFWTLDKGKIIRAEDGRIAIVSACTDISETMMVQQQLAERNSMLLSQNQELKFLNYDMPGGYHRCADTPEYDFLYISDKFLEMFGYTRGEIQELFQNKFMRMVHPKDRHLVSDGVDCLSSSAKTHNLEYRILGKHGYVWVIDQSKHMNFHGTSFFQGVVIDVTETVELRNKMRMLMENSSDNVVLINYKDGNFKYEILGDGLFRELGYTKEEYEEPWNMGQELQITRQKLAEAVRCGRNYQDTIQVKMPDNMEIWLSVDGRFIREDEEGVLYFCIYRDVTSIKKKEQELWLIRKEIESMLRLADINGWEWDIPRNLLTVSDIQHLKSGRKQDTSRLISNFPYCFLDKARVPEEYRDYFINAIKELCSTASDTGVECVFPLIKADGAVMWIKAAGESICDKEGIPIKAVGYYLDVTEQKNQELRLIKIAEVDALTGLFNRQTAIPRIKRYLAEMEDKEESAAIIMFDLDNFKLANDVFGHAYGDEMISRNARKLKSFFRSDDILCRIGGDEFLIFCKRIKDKDVHVKLEKVVKSMITVRSDGEHEIVFSVSAGYVMIPEQGREFDELYRKADVALFNAKMNGKGSFRKFESKMKEIRYELAKDK